MPATASITVRRLDPRLKQKLKKRAAAHGRSMEAEIRDILTDAVEKPAAQPERHVADQIRDIAAQYGYWDDQTVLSIPFWDNLARVPDFSAPEFGTFDDES